MNYGEGIGRWLVAVVLMAALGVVAWLVGRGFAGAEPHAKAEWVYKVVPPGEFDKGFRDQMKKEGIIHKHATDVDDLFGGPPAAEAPPKDDDEPPPKDENAPSGPFGYVFAHMEVEIAMAKRFGPYYENYLNEMDKQGWEYCGQIEYGEAWRGIVFRRPR